jgi:hypothetical protein
MFGKQPDVEDRAFSIIYTSEGEYKMLDFGKHQLMKVKFIVNRFQLPQMCLSVILG